MRLQSLRQENGLKRAASASRALWMPGLALAIFVACAIAYRFNAIFIAAASAVLGWSIAERNALKTRVAQWPIFSAYMDWQRVEHDLNKGA